MAARSLFGRLLKIPGDSGMLSQYEQVMAKKELTNARETAQAIKPGRFTVKLRSVGNPDHRQYAPVSDPVTVFVNSLREASEECRKYISEWDLGSGNWPDTFVLESGVKVARISYNGRVWDLGGNEIAICGACEEEIAEDIPPDGRWVNTPHGMVYE